MKSANSNSRMASVLQKRMGEISEYRKAQEPEFATITGSMGLKLDSFPDEIPSTDYMVCRSLLLKNIMTASAGDPTHTHAVLFPQLAAGDRVLVIWSGSEPVIVDVVQRIGG